MPAPLRSNPSEDYDPVSEVSALLDAYEPTTVSGTTIHRLAGGALVDLRLVRTLSGLKPTFDKNLGVLGAVHVVANEFDPEHKFLLHLFHPLLDADLDATDALPGLTPDQKTKVHNDKAVALVKRRYDALVQHWAIVQLPAAGENELLLRQMNAGLNYENALLKEKLVYEFGEDEVPSFQQGGKEHELLEIVTAERCTQLVQHIVEQREAIVLLQQKLSAAEKGKNVQ